MYPNHSIPIPAPCPPATSLQMLCDGGGKESSSLSIPLLAKAWGCTDSMDEQQEGDSLQGFLAAWRCSGKHHKCDFSDALREGWGMVVLGYGHGEARQV